MRTCCVHYSYDPGAGTGKTSAQFSTGRLGASLAFLLLAGAALGQGTVYFNNRVTGTLIAKVYLTGSFLPQQSGNGPSDVPAGTVDWSSYFLVSGPNYRAILLAAPGANQPESVLVPSTPTTTFRTGTAAGFVAPVTATLQNVPKDTPVATVQMFVWDNSSGLFSDPAMARLAWQSGTVVAGVSRPFNVDAIGGDINTSPLLVGLQSFTIGPLDTSPAPRFTSQPKSTTVTVGSTVTLTSAAEYCIGYQWRFWGTNLPGANAAALTIANAQTSNAGPYQVEALSQYYGSRLSVTAQLNILDPGIILQTFAGWLSPAGLRLRLFGEPGTSYTIQSTSNLLDWQTVITVTNSASFTDIIVPAVDSPRQFYRARK